MSTLKVGTIQDHANSNTAISIDSTGRLAYPAQPRFMCKLASNATIPDGNDTAWSVDDATWDERFDVGGCFANGIFTAPVAGVYHIHFQVYANPSAGSYIGASMTGTAITESFGINTLWAFRAGGNDSGFQHTVLVNATVGKTIGFGTYGNGSSTARADGTFIFGYKVA